MPKQKSHSGMKKRVKVTGTGKFRFKRTGARHLMVRNSGANKKAKRAIITLDKSFEKTVRAMLPYA
jgi:large subunit ribosomal protein L35